MQKTPNFVISCGYESNSLQKRIGVDNRLPSIETRGLMWSAAESCQLIGHAKVFEAPLVIATA